MASETPDRVLPPRPRPDTDPKAFSPQAINDPQAQATWKLKSPASSSTGALDEKTGDVSVNADGAVP